MFALRRKIRPIHGLVVMFVILSSYYSVTTPLFEAPDEPGHTAGPFLIMLRLDLELQECKA
jgi:hypothetical protein